MLDLRLVNHLNYVGFMQQHKAVFHIGSNACDEWRYQEWHLIECFIGKLNISPHLLAGP
jgi:hypothetical protein